MGTKGLKIFFVISFCLSSNLFFNPIFITENLLYYLYYGLFLVAFFIVILNYKSSENNVFAAPFFLLLIAILFSGLSATLYWDQSLIDSFKALTFYLSYILFFLLILWKIQVHDIEKIIIVLGILYILVYAITFFSYPIPIFGQDIENVNSARGFERIMLKGIGFMFLLSFFSISQFIKKRQLLWLIIFFITIISIVMSLTRTLIASSLIFLTIFILRRSSKIHKILAIIIIGGFIFLITRMDFFQLLVETTKNQTENVKDEIRILSARFYLNEFSPNIFAKIFGNGEQYPGSSYSKYKDSLEKDLGFYQSDLGYIGLYSKFGIITIIAYLILIYRTIKIPILEEYLYCKYFLYFIFLSTITVDAPFNSSYIPAIVLAIYVLSIKDLSHSEKRVSN